MASLVVKSLMGGVRYSPEWLDVMLMGRGAETILGFTLPDRESLVKTLGMCSYQSVGSRCHQELGAGI